MESAWLHDGSGNNEPFLQRRFCAAVENTIAAYRRTSMLIFIPLVGEVLGDEHGHFHVCTWRDHLRPCIGCYG
jgi:hypothetical protein